MIEEAGATWPPPPAPSDFGGKAGGDLSDEERAALRDRRRAWWEALTPAQRTAWRRERRSEEALARRRGRLHVFADGVRVKRRGDVIEVRLPAGCEAEVVVVRAQPQRRA